MPLKSTDDKATPKKKTKDRIMEAAEQLFSEKGLDATSMRDITTAAGVNLASVNYHFGSKDSLISAIFARHLEPLNAARIEMLDMAEEMAGEGTLSIEAVLEAFIRPVVVHHLIPKGENDAFMRLMGRCLSEPPTHTDYIKPHFDVLMDRFHASRSPRFAGSDSRGGLLGAALHHRHGASHSTHVEPSGPTPSPAFGIRERR